MADPTAGGRTRPEVIPEPRPVWPVTLLVVLCGYLLSAWNAWVAVLSTAPFFADIPWRGDYIRAGMGALTGALACLLFAAAGWVLGSRWGLLLLGPPALVLLGLGATMLGNPGDPHDRDPGRAVVAGDVIGEYTLVNWVVCAGLTAIIVGVSWFRRARG